MAGLFVVAAAIAAHHVIAERRASAPARAERRAARRSQPRRGLKLLGRRKQHGSVAQDEHDNVSLPEGAVPERDTAAPLSPIERDTKHPISPIERAVEAHPVPFDAPPPYPVLPAYTSGSTAPSPARPSAPRHSAPAYSPATLPLPAVSPLSSLCRF
ncbi:hypothetical protein Q5752_000950 [Cryptotrichosporon argae]